MDAKLGRVIAGILTAGFCVAPTAHAAPTTLAIAGASKSSNNQPAVMLFPIVRSGDTSYDTALAYHTIDGSAHAGVDYTAAIGTVLLQAGQINATIPIQISTNTSASADSTFELALDGATGVGPTAALSLTSTFPISGGAATVAVADLNGDGKPDVIVAHQGGTISVFLNTTAPGATTPSFSSEQIFSAGTIPLSVATADLNGDGKPDIIVADYQGNSVSVLMNTTVTGASIASFAPQQIFLAGPGPHSVVTADMNGDGKADIVVANYNNDTISVLLNTTPVGASNPTFAVQQNFSTGSGPWSIAIADVDGDGKPDVVSANYGENSISVLLNTTSPSNTTATFAPQLRFPTELGPQYLAIIDVNGDGRTDIAVAGDYSNSTSVLLNETVPGTSMILFSPSELVNSAPYISGRPMVGDVNGDGKPDLVLSGYSQGIVEVLTNTTAPGAALPSFARQQIIPSIVAAEGVAVCDVNNDGKLDVVAVSGSEVGVHLNATTSSRPLPVFDPEQTFPVGQDAYAIAVADLNGDGRPDMAVASSYANAASTLVNSTEPGWGTLLLGQDQEFSAGSGPHSIAVSDLTMDGKPDLILANYYSNTLSVFANTTTQGASTLSFSAPQSLATGANPWAVVSADINGDGKPDLLVTNFYDGTASVFLNNSTPGASTPTFSAPQTITIGPFVRSAGFSDLNGDGKPDLVISYSSSNLVNVLLNTTAPGSMVATFATHQTFPVGTFPYAIAIADINGDGKPDVVASNYGDNTVSVLLNTTVPGALTPTFGSQQVFAVGTFPYSLAVADLDGDGKPDVVTGNFGGSGAGTSITVLLNTTVAGSSVVSFSAQPPIGTSFAPSDVTLADLNADGRLDLIATHAGDTVLSTFLNAQFRTEFLGSPATGAIVHDYIFSNGFEP